MNFIKPFQSQRKRKRGGFPPLLHYPFRKSDSVSEGKSIHIPFFLFDYFEPFLGNVYAERQLKRVITAEDPPQKPFGSNHGYPKI